MIHAYHDGGSQAALTKIEELYDELFSSSAFLGELLDDWFTHPIFKNRERILSDALTAHGDGHYGASVPVLLAQAEGIVADLCEHENIDPASATSTTIAIEDLASNQVTGTYSTHNNEVTFTPDGPLSGNTDYRVMLRSGSPQVADTAGNALGLTDDYQACLITTEAQAPVVMGVDPADTAVGVALDKTIAVRFSEPMSLASLYSTKFSPAQTGTVQLSHTDQCGSDAQVLGCISMSSTLTSLYFDPVSPYELDGDISPYRFTLTDGSSLPISQPTDLGGLVLPVFHSTFSTTDGPPVVSCTMPADNSTIGTVGDNIVVHFNEPVAFDTFDATSFRLFRVDDGSDVSGTFPIAADGTAMVFDPTVDLAGGGVDYELVVDTGVQDADGGTPLAHIYRATFNTPP